MTFTRASDDAATKARQTAPSPKTDYCSDHLATLAPTPSRLGTSAREPNPRGRPTKYFRRLQSDRLHTNLAFGEFCGTDRQSPLTMLQDSSCLSSGNQMKQHGTSSTSTPFQFSSPSHALGPRCVGPQQCDSHSFVSRGFFEYKNPPAKSSENPAEDPVTQESLGIPLQRLHTVEALPFCSSLPGFLANKLSRFVGAVAPTLFDQATWDRHLHLQHMPNGTSPAHGTWTVLV